MIEEMKRNNLFFEFPLNVCDKGVNVRTELSSDHPQQFIKLTSNHTAPTVTGP